MKYTRMLLSVWREACRHVHVGECTGLIAPLLTEHLPCDLVLVRRIDAQRHCIETVGTGATGPTAPRVRARDDLDTGAMERLLAWCRRGAVASPGDRTHEVQVELFVPRAIGRDFLAGPLTDVTGITGVLILGSRRRNTFKPRHKTVFRALLEPFSVALENDQRLRELNALREAAEADKRSLLTRLGRQDIADTIVGSDAGLRQVMQQVDQVAGSDVAVLILGETGSGKEVIARAIHTRSRFSAGPFLRVNCGAIPSELIDSELFGHERGSFTGATGLRKGWFERADGGTLFLDEVGELPLAAQVRLLRILQDGTFERVGGQQQLKVELRVVAATHRNLEAMVADGRFREDLWYRIAVFPIRLPSLRDRPEDLPALAAHFALRASRRFGTAPLTPSRADIELLLSYPWPGNVRELAAVIDRATILGNGHHLDVATALGVQPPRPSSSASGHRPGAGGPGSEPLIAPVGDSHKQDQGASPLPALDAAMAAHIETALRHCGGRIEGPHGAARLLKINPHTLRARMRKLGIPWRHFRRASDA